jgi:hypothetical protein
MVAFERSSWHRQLGSTHRVVVIDLASRTRMHSVATGPLSPEQEQPPGRPDERNTGIGPVTALAVHPTGAVAWVARDFYSRRPGTRFQVRRADSAGTVRLAFGTGILAASLHVEGGRVSWIQHGRAASARLAVGV